MRCGGYDFNEIVPLSRTLLPTQLLIPEGFFSPPKRQLCKTLKPLGHPICRRDRRMMDQVRKHQPVQGSLELPAAMCYL